MHNNLEEIIIFVDEDSDANPSNLSENDNIEDIIKIENEDLTDDSQFIYIDGEFMEVVPADADHDDEDHDDVQYLTKDIIKTNKKRMKSFGTNLVLCTVCGKLIMEKNMPRHFAIHGRKDCEVCGKRFETFEELEEHKLEHLGNDYPCVICNESFKDALDHVIHVHKHTNVYSCLRCNFATSNKSSIKGHIKRHEGKYTHYCEICGKGFLGRALLQSHEEMHLDIKRYSCEICQKKFSVKRYLHIHKSLNHKKELYGIDQLFQCEVCGREFTFEKSLRRHQSVIHHIGEDRTVECSVCHKIIANNYNLKMHMRIHTGEKKFCCDLCGKAFTAYKYWKKHMLSHDRQKREREDSYNFDTQTDRDDVANVHVYNFEDVDEAELDSDNFIVDFDALD